MKPIVFMDIDGVLNAYNAYKNKNKDENIIKKFIVDGSDYERYYFVRWIQDFEDYDEVQLNVWGSQRQLSIFNFTYNNEILEAVNNIANDDRFDFVWATTWTFEAKNVSEIFDIPVDTPYVDLDKVSRTVFGSHNWKSDPVISYAGETPFIFFDDEVTDRDNDYVNDYHNGKTVSRFVNVDPIHGFTGKYVNMINSWYEENFS